MIVFQKVPPRRRPGPRRIYRSVAHHLRVLYEPPRSPGRRRHHLAAVVLPASSQQIEDFVARCATKLAGLGVSPEVSVGIVEGIGLRAARESAKQAEAERVLMQAGARLRAIALDLARAHHVARAPPRRRSRP